MADAGTCDPMDRSSAVASAGDRDSLVRLTPQHGPACGLRCGLRMWLPSPGVTAKSQYSILTFTGRIAILADMSHPRKVETLKQLPVDVLAAYCAALRNEGGVAGLPPRLVDMVRAPAVPVCANGHELFRDTTYVRTTGPRKGKRECRTCTRAARELLAAR